MTSSSATEVSVASELRHQLVEHIRVSNHIRSAALESAFRTVSRHAFTPEAPPEGGFDVIVFTVDTGDLPWIDALPVGGRLVAPPRLHGYHWAIGFTKEKGVLHSDEPLVICGFVAIHDDGAWNPNRRTVPGPGAHLFWEDGSPLSVDQRAPALTRRPTATRTNITVEGQAPFDLLTLYLAGALPGFCRLDAAPDGDHQVLNPPPPHWPAAAIVRRAPLPGSPTSASETARAGTSSSYRVTATTLTPAARKLAERVESRQRNHRDAPLSLSPHHPDLAPGTPCPGEVRFVYDAGTLTPDQVRAIRLPHEQLSEYAFLKTRDAVRRLRPVDAQIMLAAYRARLGNTTTAHLADGQHILDVPALDRHDIHVRYRPLWDSPLNRDPVPELFPVQQAWAWCFVPDGRVVLVADPGPRGALPMLPGGTVESTDATPEDTLRREAAEEAQLTLSDPVRLGWVLDETGKVDGGAGPNARLRLAARVTAIGPEEIPAEGMRPS
ncbi:NUDIX domain-containing protein [Streptomyces drozdowiczii]